MFEKNEIKQKKGRELKGLILLIKNKIKKIKLYTPKLIFKT